MNFSFSLPVALNLPRETSHLLPLNNAPFNINYSFTWSHLPKMSSPTPVCLMSTFTYLKHTLEAHLLAEGS